MLHIVKTINLIIKGTLLLGGLLIAAVVALLPISAGAQCSGNWNANGHMTLRQAGSKATEIWLSHKGKAIQGTALAIVRRGGSNDGERRMTGTIDGSFDGDNFSVQIYWDNGQTGVYNGKVLLSGRLDGEAWEKRSPNVRIPWHTDEGLNCVVLVKTPPPVIPKPIKSSGKARPAPTPAAPKPPFIVAGQPIIPPYMAYGTVYLGWEGGPDHPNVEVFLSIDNGAEIPAFSMEHTPQSPVWKQPKIAAIPLKLQRYHHYKFVLKAAGKTLSTAAFVVP